MKAIILSQKWSCTIKIALLSDTHEKHEGVAVPDADMVIHAGDLTMIGAKSAYEGFFRWFEALPHKHKIVIPGNHDFAFLHNIGLIKPNVTVLLDESVTIEGLKFYGSPYTPRFGQWAFMMERGESLYQHWLKIPHDTDVLITHGPPLGMLDTIYPDGEHCGDYDLSVVVETIKPKLHVFGHIHGGYGSREFQGVHYVNAAVVNEAYQPVNPVQVVEI